MSVGLIAGFVLFLACVWQITAPLFSEIVPSLNDGNEATIAELRAKRAKSIDQELELDYKTGKMSESDYRELHSKS